MHFTATLTVTAFSFNHSSKYDTYPFHVSQIQSEKVSSLSEFTVNNDIPITERNIKYK